MRVTTAYLERVARDYQRAYAAANEGPAPYITWQRGWFIVGPHSIRYRRKDLEEMRDELRRRAPLVSRPNGETP